MKKSKKIKFNGRELEVCELTVHQVTSWLEDLRKTDAAEQLHTLDGLMGRDLPVSVIRLAVPDLTDEDLDQLPSEISRIYEAVEEMNPFLSQMAARVTKAAGKLGL